MDKEANAINYTLKDDACIVKGAKWLSEKEPRFRKIYRRVAPLHIRIDQGGYESLLRAIVSQQLSVASARSIWKKLQKADLVSANAIIRADDEILQKCGLSAPKRRYMKALAQSGIDFEALKELPNSEIIKILTAVSGIGVWTAEIYAMFSLGRVDIFAAGDLALQESARLVFELESRPSEKTLRQLAQNWSPWRSIAAQLLWEHYRLIKKREGIV